MEKYCFILSYDGKLHFSERMAVLQYCKWLATLPPLYTHFLTRAGERQC